MIYFFKTAVILSAYLTVTIIGAYLIKLVERVIVLTLVLVNQYTVKLCLVTEQMNEGLMINIEQKT